MEAVPSSLVRRVGESSGLFFGSPLWGRMGAAVWIAAFGSGRGRWDGSGTFTRSVVERCRTARKHHYQSGYLRGAPNRVGDEVLAAGSEPAGAERRSRLPKGGRPRLDVDADRARAELERGLSLRRVAKLLGVSPRTLRRRLGRGGACLAGVPLPEGGAKPRQNPAGATLRGG